jgi:hypothetical protein
LDKTWSLEFGSDHGGLYIIVRALWPPKVGIDLRNHQPTMRELFTSCKADADGGEPKQDRRWLQFFIHMCYNMSTGAMCAPMTQMKV